MNGNTLLVVVGISFFMLIREMWLNVKGTESEPEPEEEPQEQDQEKPFFDSARLQREISLLYHESQELEKLDSMIIDLRLCKPGELHRAFRVEWQATTGANRSADFIADGLNANTAQMLRLAECQREQLNTSIQARICDLYTRAQALDFYAAYDAERSYTNGERNDAGTGAGE